MKTPIVLWVVEKQEHLRGDWTFVAVVGTEAEALALVTAYDRAAAPAERGADWRTLRGDTLSWGLSRHVVPVALPISIQEKR